MRSESITQIIPRPFFCVTNVRVIGPPGKNNSQTIFVCNWPEFGEFSCVIIFGNFLCVTGGSLSLSLSLSLPCENSSSWAHLLQRAPRSAAAAALLKMPSTLSFTVFWCFFFAPAAPILDFFLFLYTDAMYVFAKAAVTTHPSLGGGPFQTAT